MKRHLLLLTSASFALVLATLAAQSPAGPPLFSTVLPKEEFASRRAKVFERIGEGVAVLQRGTETTSYEKFRQSNQFYYLAGVPTPRVIVVLARQARSRTLYLLPTTEAMERSEGP